MASVFDCITFFDENFLVNSRFEILKDSVDYFIICESGLFIMITEEIKKKLILN